MFDRVLRRMRSLVRERDYVITLHGHEEMEADALTAEDLEHVVLTGRIIERQRDPRRGEWKYVIEGESLGNEAAVVVAKIGPTRKLVVLTVYVL